MLNVFSQPVYLKLSQGATFAAVTVLGVRIWETELSSQPALPSGTGSTMLPWERLAVVFPAVCVPE